MILKNHHTNFRLVGIRIVAVAILVIASYISVLNFGNNPARAINIGWEPEISDIAFADQAVCILTDGDVYCWGENSYGNLGDGTETTRNYPKKIDTSGVLAGKTITDIEAAGESVCAIADGALYCWGRNLEGQLGDGTTESKSVPVAVDTSGVLAGKTISKVVMQGAVTCAFSVDQELFCWGLNTSGQVGNGTTDAALVPTVVDTSGALNGREITDMFVSSYQGVICVIADDQPYCWGSGTSGLLGTAVHHADYAASPVLLEGVQDKVVTDISFSNLTGCLIADGKLYCWGQNSNGSLGVGSDVLYISQELVAVDVSGSIAGKDFVDVEVRANTVCALSTEGNMYCWGENYFGTFGNGTTDRSNVPVPVDTEGALSGKSITSFSAGAWNICAFATNELFCWGTNPGDGSDESYVPVAVDTTRGLAGKTLTSVGMNNSVKCVVADNVPYCWGVPNRVGNENENHVKTPTNLIQKRLQITSVVSNTGVEYIGVEGYAIAFGSDIQQGATVTVGGIPATIEIANSNAIGFIPPAITIPGDYDVVVTNPDGDSVTLFGALTYEHPVERVITNVTFETIDSKPMLKIHGEGLIGSLDANEFTTALQQSLVSLNGQALPFCAEGTGATAALFIEQGTSAELVSDTPICYFLLLNGEGVLNPTQALIWLSDDFDAGAPGMVQIKGSNVFSFNQTDGGDPDPDPDPNPDPDPDPDPDPEPNTGNQNGQQNNNTQSQAQSPSIAQTTTTPPVTTSTTVIIQADDKSLTEGPKEITKKPTFTGKAAPFSTVTITIYSDPVICTTTADANGDWSCTLDQELPAGSHRVFVKVQQPDGEVVEAGPFDVEVKGEQQTPPTITSNDTPSQEGSSVQWGWIVGGGVVLLLAILIAIGVARSKRA